MVRVLFFFVAMVIINSNFRREKKSNKVFSFLPSPKIKEEISTEVGKTKKRLTCCRSFYSGFSFKFEYKTPNCSFLRFRSSSTILRIAQ